MTWLASTDSVKELKAAVEELRVQVDACGQKAEDAGRQVHAEAQAAAATEEKVRTLQAQVSVLTRPLLGRLSWLVTGK